MMPGVLAESFVVHPAIVANGCQRHSKWMIVGPQWKWTTDIIAYSGETRILLIKSSNGSMCYLLLFGGSKKITHIPNVCEKWESKSGS